MANTFSAHQWMDARLWKRGAGGLFRSSAWRKRHFRLTTHNIRHSLNETALGEFIECALRSCRA